MSNTCSVDAAYNNNNATDSGLEIPDFWQPYTATGGKDVWFKFTAIAYDVNIAVSGNVSGGGSRGGTLERPLIALYRTNCNRFESIIGSMLNSGNATTYYKGGLTIGAQYYIRVSAANNNTGTFKMCVNNYTPPARPGQDCQTAAVLCSKESFTELNVSGAGINNRESAGTCVGMESNTAWYKWTAANNGTLAFIITPTTSTDDIDWVLYDLGESGDCSNVTAANAMRCAAGHGVANTRCPQEAKYYKTGLSFTETDTTEASGCGQGQNGYVKYINMQENHVYALLVNNFSSANNGFTIEFEGTGEFKGPEAAFEYRIDNLCFNDQEFTFSNLSANYSSIRWSFGEGASISSASTAGPHTIRYATPGQKTVVLEARENDCFTVAVKTFYVGAPLRNPNVYTNKVSFCLGDTIRISADSLANIPDSSYYWTGPDRFISRTRSVNIPVTGPEVAGTYKLLVWQGDCHTDTAAIIIPSILNKPVAAFHTEPRVLPKLSFPVTIHFDNDSENGDTFLWDFGDGETSTEEHPAHLYKKPGEFSVTLTAFKKDVCYSSVTQGSFLISENNAIFIPNTFTPNGDHINDEFVITITNLLRYRIRVFNRWGKELFVTNDIYENWKGDFKGEPVPFGTYYYIIDGDDMNGNTIKKAGSVTLIR